MTSNLPPTTIVDELPFVPLKRFRVNKNGRDFIVGDLHGQISFFRALLDEVKFNPEIDRVFSCGDLIDRGVDSGECLALLDEPWFFACLGNHELMMFDVHRGFMNDHLWFENGGTWAVAEVHDLHNMKYGREFNMSTKMFWEDNISRISQMPLMMTVSTKNRKKFHLVHAELPYVRITGDLDKKLLNRKFVRKIWADNSSQSIFDLGMYSGCWRRDIFNFYPTTGGGAYVEEVIQQFTSSTIYSGHTIQRSARPTKTKQLICLDTGSFKKGDYGVTIIEHSTQRSWLANSHGVTETSNDWTINI